MRTLILLAPLLAMPAAAQTGQDPEPASQVAEPAPALPGPPAPPGIQFLYGSGEGAAAYRTIWRALVDYVDEARKRPRSVIVDPAWQPGDRDMPHWSSCAGKPKAIVLDMDETVLLNGGFEYDAAMGTPYSDARWRAWEVHGWPDVEATPGAIAALHRVRQMGVTVIFNSNRLAADAVQDVQALKAAGLLEEGREALALYAAEDAASAQKAKQTLFLARSSAPADAAKDGRRAAIAAHWCVLAMGGDQLGDFWDGFNPPPGKPIADPLARRGRIDRFAETWGAGWFVFPNPAYGTALAGSATQIFKGLEWPTPQPPENK